MATTQVTVTLVRNTGNATFTVNDDGGAPVEGATIAITGFSTVTTDAQGKYTTSQHPLGTYNFVASKAGFTPATGSFVIA
ncbi:MAG: carboxypeptidase-like regulatory domain-containing protein [Patescibacteria group bacterium]